VRLGQASTVATGLTGEGISEKSYPTPFVFPRSAATLSAGSRRVSCLQKISTGDSAMPARGHVGKI